MHDFQELCSSSLYQVFMGWLGPAPTAPATAGRTGWTTRVRSDVRPRTFGSPAPTLEYDLFELVEPGAFGAGTDDDQMFKLLPTCWPDGFCPAPSAPAHELYLLVAPGSDVRCQLPLWLGAFGADARYWSSHAYVAVQHDVCCLSSPAPTAPAWTSCAAMKRVRRLRRRATNASFDTR